MTLLHLALQNVRHQARNYAAFFLSSAFAVWMFFLYGSLLLHPRLSAAALPDMLRETSLFIEGVVALFSILFVRYAHAAFLKARMREIATLSLLGMRPGQLFRLVRYENLTIGLGATTAGVVLGLASLKLFLLAMSRVLRLDEPIPFAISWPAIGCTYGAFLLIFLVIGWLGQWRLRRIPVAEVFQEASRPKEPPVFAWWKVALSAATLLPAYYLTLTANGANIGDKILYILLLLFIGTYLLLSQGSVAILRGLQRRPALYTRRTNLLILSQLIYKMRDNARILFMVATLSSLSLIAIGLFSSAWIVSAEKAEEAWPVGLRIHGEPGGLTAERVDQVLAQHQLEVTASAAIPRISRSTFVYQSGRMHHEVQGPNAVMPLSAVNDWLRRIGREEIALETGSGAILSDHRRELEGQTVGFSLAAAGGPPTLPGAEETLFAFHVERVLPMVPLNEYEALVLDDALFAQLARVRPVEVSHLWQLADWRASLPAAVQLVEEVRANWTDDQPFRLPGPLVAPALALDSFQRTNGLGLFLAAFVATLFFLASGNMLYFKLFTDLYDDRRQFQALGKVGILPGEVQRVVSTQTLVLFFVPLFLAVVNATVGLHLFTSIFAIDLWEPLAITVGGYSLLYLAYFLVTRRTYVAALMARH